MSGEHYNADTHRRNMTLCEKCEKILDMVVEDCLLGVDVEESFDVYKSPHITRDGIPTYRYHWYEDGGGDNVTIEFCKPCREVMNKNIREINNEEKKEKKKKIQPWYNTWFDPRTAILVTESTITTVD